MSNTYPLARLILLAAGVGLIALLSNRFTERIKIPAPLLVLVAATIAVNSIPDLHAPPEQLVERLVTVALICILFDGCLHMGWAAFRSAAAPIAVTGVLGTFLKPVQLAIADGAAPLEVEINGGPPLQNPHGRRQASRLPTDHQDGQLLPPHSMCWRV